MPPHTSISPHTFAGLVARQSIADQARETLGSWDACMSKAYCKWPVVAAIIIGGLIVLSIVLCIARFCCCGLECCCFCCSCFNRCCPSPRRKDKTQYIQAPQYPQQYGYTPQMNYGGPQFATYDVSKNGQVKEDALPVMPSWQQAQTSHVEDTSYQGGGGQDAIAMGAMGGAASKMKDDDLPYRDDDQLQPMLSKRQSRVVSPSLEKYLMPSEKAAFAKVYDDQQQDSSAPASIGEDHHVQGHQQPQHNYGNLDQSTHPAYRNEIATSPSSMYSSAYPQQHPSRAPTYRSEAPTYHSQQPQPNQALSPVSPQNGYGQSGYTNFSRNNTQSTRYEPTTHELPGSLSVGNTSATQQFYGGQQPQQYSQQQQQQQYTGQQQQHNQTYDMGEGYGYQGYQR